MTIYQGTLAPNNLLHQQAGRSAMLDALVMNHEPGGWTGSAALTGARVNTQPVDEPATTRSGYLAPGFVDDWYYRIHITPNPLSLGFLLAAQDRQVEVWNAHFDARTLQGITEQGTDGMSLAGPVPPADWTALQSIAYTASFETSGPPTIDAAYTFEWEQNEDVTLRITGQRVALFAFPHNWRSPWSERLEWLTDVQTGRDGTEQVVALRGVPRRSMEQEVLAANHAATILDRSLFAWQARVYAVPVASDGERLATQVDAGAISLPIADTTDRDYRAGGLAMVSTRPDLAEAVEIASVQPTSLTLVNPTQVTWPANARVWPVRLARLDRNQPVAQVTAGVKVARLRWRCVDRSAATPEAGGTIYQGADVLLDRPNRVRAVTADYARLTEVIDGATGAWAVDDPPNQSFQTDQFDFLLRDRAAVQAWRRWLYYRAGRQKRFWIPTWQADLEVVGEWGAASTLLPVRPISYELFYQSRPGRRHVALQLRTGAWLLREVSGGQVVGPDLEYLQVDAGPGQTLQAADIKRACWLRLVRLAGDAAEIAWITAGVAQVRLSVRTKL